MEVEEPSTTTTTTTTTNPSPPVPLRCKLTHFSRGTNASILSLPVTVVEQGVVLQLQLLLNYCEAQRGKPDFNLAWLQLALVPYSPAFSITDTKRKDPEQADKQLDEYHHRFNGTMAVYNSDNNTRRLKNQQKRALREALGLALATALQNGQTELLITTEQWLLLRTASYKAPKKFTTQWELMIVFSHNVRLVAHAFHSQVVKPQQEQEPRPDYDVVVYDEATMRPAWNAFLDRAEHEFAAANAHAMEGVTAGNSIPEYSAVHEENVVTLCAVEGGGTIIGYCICELLRFKTEFGSDYLNIILRNDMPNDKQYNRAYFLKQYPPGNMFEVRGLSVLTSRSGRDIGLVLLLHAQQFVRDATVQRFFPCTHLTAYSASYITKRLLTQHFGYHYCGTNKFNNQVFLDTISEKTKARLYNYIDVYADSYSALWSHLIENYEHYSSALPDNFLTAIRDALYACVELYQLYYLLCRSLRPSATDTDDMAVGRMRNDAFRDTYGTMTSLFGAMQKVIDKMRRHLSAELQPEKKKKLRKTVQDELEKRSVEYAALDVYLCGNKTLISEMTLEEHRLEEVTSDPSLYNVIYSTPNGILRSYGLPTDVGYEELMRQWQKVTELSELLLAPVEGQGASLEEPVRRVIDSALRLMRKLVRRVIMKDLKDDSGYEIALYGIKVIRDLLKKQERRDDDEQKLLNEVHRKEQYLQAMLRIKRYFANFLGIVVGVVPEERYAASEEQGFDTLLLLSSERGQKAYQATLQRYVTRQMKNYGRRREELVLQMEADEEEESVEINMPLFTMEINAGNAAEVVLVPVGDPLQEQISECLLSAASTTTKVKEKRTLKQMSLCNLLLKQNRAIENLKSPDDPQMWEVVQHATKKPRLSVTTTTTTTKEPQQEELVIKLGNMKMPSRQAQIDWDKDLSTEAEK